MTPLQLTSMGYYPGDFVVVDPVGREGTLPGSVIAASSEDEDTATYIVQPYTSSGPTDATLTVTADELALHPTGRLSVMDNISRLRFNNR